MRQVNAGVLGLGAALEIAIGAAAWKASSLRSDLISSYGPRLDLARARLDERAHTDLERLAARITETLGLDSSFDPLQVIVDPSQMLPSIVEIKKILTLRRRLPVTLRWLLRVGPILLALLVAVFLSVLPTFIYFSGAWSDRTVGIVGLVAFLVLMCLVLITTGVYFVLQHIFGGIEAFATK